MSNVKPIAPGIDIPAGGSGQFPALVPGQKRIDLTGIFLIQHRTCRIDQPAALPNMGNSVVEHGLLHILKRRKAFGRQCPLGLGRATPRARTGTGGIAKDKVEAACAGDVFGAAQGDVMPAPRGARRQVAHALGVYVVGRHLPATGRQRQRLAPAACALTERGALPFYAERRRLARGILNFDHPASIGA